MAVAENKVIAVKRLRPNPANARTHSKKQIGQIARSIRQFGFTSPIIADEKRTILAGHGRWLAARELGLLQVPVIVVSGLSEAERRAFLIADNKIAENAGWDRLKLGVELDDLLPLLEGAQLEIELTGFSPAEVDAMLGDLVDPEQDPSDDIPEIAQQAISRPGDVWLLDRHRLCCGDAKVDADFRKLMGRERAAMAFADPPFNIRIRFVQPRGKVRHGDFVEG